MVSIVGQGGELIVTGLSEYTVPRDSCCADGYQLYLHTWSGDGRCLVRSGAMRDHGVRVWPREAQREVCDGRISRSQGGQFRHHILIIYFWDVPCARGVSDKSGLWPPGAEAESTTGRHA
jgi:hypothetical protein